MRSIFLLIAFIAAASAFPAHAASGISSWNVGCHYTYQGHFVPGGAVKGIDCNVATALFPGNSDAPIHPFGECVYLDNSTDKTYFVPLKSPPEWESFKKHLPKGISLRACSTP